MDKWMNEWRDVCFATIHCSIQRSMHSVRIGYNQHHYMDYCCCGKTHAETSTLQNAGRALTHRFVNCCCVTNLLEHVSMVIVQPKTPKVRSTKQ